MTIATLINELSFEYDRFDYESKDFLPHDEMGFARRVLMEKMLDGLYFLRYGGKKGTDTELYAATKKRQYEADRASYDGTEIAMQKLRGSLAAFQAAQHKHDQLDEMYTDMQHAWYAAYGEWYVPYGAPVGYSFSTQNAPAQEAEIPQDILELEQAMGLAPKVANDLIEEPEKKKA